jgi:hypothetical protein
MAKNERLLNDVEHERMKHEVGELVETFLKEVDRQTHSYKEVRTDDLLDGIKQVDDQGEVIKSILDDRGGSGGWVIQVYSLPIEEPEIEDEEEEEEE